MADITTQAVVKQVKAFGVHTYDVGIRSAGTGKMMNETWDKEQVIKAVPKLKALNLSGNDIYIRPHDDSPFVLLDDIDEETVKRLESDGLRPAILVQTSPGNRQAWIKLSGGSLDRETRKAVARYLANAYDADLASADGHHYGRLAGFTNRKPKYIDENGRYPWVLLERSNGLVVTNGQSVLEMVAKYAQRPIEVTERNGLSMAIEKAGSMPENNDKLFAKWYADIIGFLQEEELPIDYNSLDWYVARHAILKGYSKETIIGAMLAHSPMLLGRKSGHINDYLLRTYWKALAYINSNQPYDSVKDKLLDMAKELASVQKDQSFASN
jgi:hypothetical protein